MGLWIKNDDGSIEKVAGSGGGGGSFDGEHVLTGDVDNPPEELDVGQLMWDGVEGGSGGGGGDGGPHDHDYLPLEGGVLTGDLTVDGTINTDSIAAPPNTELSIVSEKGLRLDSGGRDHNGTAYPFEIVSPLVEMSEDVKIGLSLRVEGGVTVVSDLKVDGVTETTGLIARANGSSSPTNPNIIFGDVGVNAQTGFYRNSTGAIQVACEGEPVARFGLEKLQLYNDLQVDGLIYGQLGPVPDDFWTTHSNGIVFTGHGMVSGSQGSYRQSITCNGYRNTDNKWTSIETGGNVGATVIELTPNGGFHVLAASNYPTGSTAQPPMRFQVTETTTTIWNTFNPAGGTTFGITEGIDTQDVLDRAETATMPAIDEEGVATADVKGVMLNDVVTALLAKVKELSARIEELEGN